MRGIQTRFEAQNGIWTSPTCARRCLPDYGEQARRRRYLQERFRYSVRHQCKQTLKFCCLEWESEQAHNLWMLDQTATILIVLCRDRFYISGQDARNAMRSVSCRQLSVSFALYKCINQEAQILWCSRRHLEGVTVWSQAQMESKSFVDFVTTDILAVVVLVPMRPVSQDKGVTPG